MTSQSMNFIHTEADGTPVKTQARMLSHNLTATKLRHFYYILSAVMDKAELCNISINSSIPVFFILV